MTTQQMLMYGLSRSPILAHFQKTPVTPFLFLSRMPGVKWWTYVLVQMSSRMTRRRDWKLKSADMLFGLERQHLCDECGFKRYGY